MNRITWTAWVLGIAYLFGAGFAFAAERQPNRVVVIYFHRTQRCPTCLKMSSYTEEAVKRGFASQLRDGVVEFRLIDFESQKFAALAHAYGVKEPSLIVIKVENDRAKSFKKLDDIWAKVSDKQQFTQYVQKNVASMLPSSRPTLERSSNF